jgi:hypothetical protein
MWIMSVRGGRSGAGRAAATEYNENIVRRKVSEQRRTTAGSQEREQVVGAARSTSRSEERDGDGKRRCRALREKIGWAPRDTCWMQEAKERST